MTHADVQSSQTGIHARVFVSCFTKSPNSIYGLNTVLGDALLLLDLSSILLLFLLLARIGDCHIEQSSQSPNVYSCLVPDNLDVNYDVHIISVYEASSNRFFGQHPTGTSNVRLFVSGEVVKPIILVLVSYEPIEWRLSIPSGVEIERVLLVRVTEV